MSLICYGEQIRMGHRTQKLPIYAQNRTNSSTSLLVNNVISFLIGPTALVPITSIMHQMDEGTRPCPLSVAGNRSGRVTEPKHYQFMPKIGLILKLGYL